MWTCLLIKSSRARSTKSWFSNTLNLRDFSKCTSEWWPKPLTKLASTNMKSWMGKSDTKWVHQVTPYQQMSITGTRLTLPTFRSSTEEMWAKRKRKNRLGLTCSVATTPTLMLQRNTSRYWVSRVHWKLCMRKVCGLFPNTSRRWALFHHNLGIRDSNLIRQQI